MSGILTVDEVTQGEDVCPEARERGSVCKQSREQNGEGTQQKYTPCPLPKSGAAVSYGDVTAFQDYDQDFNGSSRPGTFRGGYAGEGTNPGWRLSREIKPDVSGLVFADGFESGTLAAWSGSS